MTADPLIGHRDAAILDAVGPLDHKRERKIQSRPTLRIAQQRHDMHGFARAIDAAFGIDEGVEPRRRRAAGDAAVAQIECRAFQIEKSIVALRVGRDQHGRRQRPLAARQSRLEGYAAVGVALFGAEHFIAARHQPHLDLALGLGGGERIHEHVDAVGAGIGSEPHVGHDEPLGRHIVVVFGGRALGLRRHHIDSGRHVTDRQIDRERGGDLGILGLLNGKFTAPHLDAAAVGQPFDLVGRKIALEVAAEHGLDQVSVADAVN